MTFEMCVFLVIVGVIGVFVTVWKRLIADTSLDFLRIEHSGAWGSPGVGKVYPAARECDVCDVCGKWTPGKTCSECVTWAEIQIIRRENFMTMKALLGQPINLWNEGLHVSHTHAPCDNTAEHRRLVEAAGW